MKKLSIVGIGPGDVKFMSQRALEVIKSSQTIVGYTTYIKLLGDLTVGKEVISTGMTKELERAKVAVERALEGSDVCVISSGDSGIYGMAGLVLELLSAEKAKRIKVEIVPGISAATSCAALLGAPLMNDFVTISLSDLLTDLELIKQRIECAAQGDFVVVLYNPKSRKRIEPFESAWRILMKHRSPNTPVGIVRNAARENEEVVITTLEDMLSEKIDMGTTIIVGNSRSYVKGKYMITPRGYKLNEHITYATDKEHKL